MSTRKKRQLARARAAVLGLGPLHAPATETPQAGETWINRNSGHAVHVTEIRDAVIFERDGVQDVLALDTFVRLHRKHAGVCAWPYREVP